MAWESSGVVGFDLGPLLQGQTRIAKLKSAYNLLIRFHISLITAARGLWSPLNNFLGFQIFLSFLSFFKTIGAEKNFGILCGDLKLYLR